MIEPLKLNKILRDIKNPDFNFTFSRWGDGEWRSVLQRHKPGAANCDRHKFFDAMGVELANVLKGRPEYMLGMQNLAMRMYTQPIHKFLARNDLQDLKWYESDVFHYGAIHGYMDKIVSAVNTCRLIVVGPPHLKRLNQAGLSYRAFVEVPPKNCYLNLREIYRETLAAVEDQKGHTLISISASMPAEILCDMLYKKIGQENTIIDFGSLWDPLVGKKSRRYMHDRPKRR